MDTMDTMDGRHVAHVAPRLWVLTCVDLDLRRTHFLGSSLGSIRKHSQSFAGIREYTWYLELALRPRAIGNVIVRCCMLRVADTHGTVRRIL